MMTATPATPAETFIFPLHTVLFPGGLLPLKIFEQRYIEMTKICLSEEREFGVCLIKDGREVGSPAVPYEVGCLARIAQWDMPQLGVFHLMAEGTRRFRISQTTVRNNGLICARIETLPPEPEVAPVDTLCGKVLKTIIDKVGTERFPAPLRMDDAAWIGYRLSEVLPIDVKLRQEFLEMNDPQVRLQRLSEILSRQGVEG